jgi:hypothetical protein
METKAASVLQSKFIESLLTHQRLQAMKSRIDRGVHQNREKPGSETAITKRKKV